LKDQITREAKEKADKVQKLEHIAKDLGLSLAVFALAWCLKNPNVSTVILGASKVAQLTENLQAVDAQAKLTPEIMEQVDKLVGI
jgi:aryl-alcohol dehydrogenase-like predicted oxidoreductase